MTNQHGISKFLNNLNSGIYVNRPENCVRNDPYYSVKFTYEADGVRNSVVFNPHLTQK